MSYAWYQSLPRVVWSKGALDTRVREHSQLRAACPLLITRSCNLYLAATTLLLEVLEIYSAIALAVLSTVSMMKCSQISWLQHGNSKWWVLGLDISPVADGGFLVHQPSRDPTDHRTPSRQLPLRYPPSPHGHHSRHQSLGFYGK